jgi:hypothetical protein
VVSALRHWQEDTDLTDVREKIAVAKLPEEERDPWSKLWTDVDALIAKAREMK